MRLIKPPALGRGDTVGLIAPASAPWDAGMIDAAVARLEELGFRVKLGRHVRRRHGFLAGTDRQRASDLMEMFQARPVRGIVCVRGGYGTARLLPLLDYRAIREHPKPLVGYSDITSLHCALLSQAGLVSFHGPMGAADLAGKNLPEHVIESWLRCLCEPKPAGDFSRAWPGTDSVVCLRKGVATGRLLGGNLTILSMLVGTRYEPSWRGALLMLEEVDEAPYRIDRMLTFLLNTGRLRQVAGVAVGICRNCQDAKAEQTTEYRQSLRDVIEERLRPLKVPLVMGLPFGHGPENLTWPVGVRAVLDAGQGRLNIEEAGVRENKEPVI